MPVLSITGRPSNCDKDETREANGTADAVIPVPKFIIAPGGTVGRSAAFVGGAVPGGGGGGGGGGGRAPGPRAGGGATSFNFNPFFTIVSSYTGSSRVSRCDLN